MKQCPQCHRVYGHEAFFCLEDGTPLTDTRDPESTEVRTIHLSSPPGPRVPKKSDPALWVLLGLITVIILLVVGKEISNNLNEQTRTTSAPQTTASAPPTPVSTPEPQRKRTPRPTPSPEPTPYPTYNPSSTLTRIVVPETLELGTSGWKAFPFSIGYNGGRVTGEFAARGGMADDMRVLIIADSELEPFRNKYPFRSYHDTGKTTGGSLDVSLPPGNYYIVIVNPSPWTSRRIRAPINLENN